MLSYKSRLQQTLRNYRLGDEHIVDYFDPDFTIGFDFINQRLLLAELKSEKQAKFSNWRFSVSTI